MLRSLRFGFLGVLLGITVSAWTMASDKLEVGEVVTSHLKNLNEGPEIALTHNRVITGQAAMKILDGGTGFLVGKATFHTNADQVKLLFEFDSGGYPKDGFTCTGRDRIVPEQIQGGANGFLADFIDQYRQIARSGLFGGVLSSAWSLTDFEKAGFSCTSDGVRKIEGQDLHAIKCDISSVITSTLYFEPETFRHVRTLHRIPPSNGDALLTEQFREFRRVNGLEVPTLWDIFMEYRGGKRVQWQIGLQGMDFPE
jgi:hypothetical protein